MPHTSRALRLLVSLCILLWGALPAGAAPNTAGRFFCKYKPNYLALGVAENGAGRPTSRLQISFRYTLWDFPGEPDAEGVPTEDHCSNPTSDHQLKFGYTQKSLWRLWEASAPFDANNYNPEIYYSLRIHREHWKEVTFGIEHESNGLGGVDSRSWNRIYAQAKFQWKLGEDHGGAPEPFLSERELEWQATLYAKAWYATPWDLENDSLVDSLGYFKLIAVLRTPDSRFGGAEIDVEVSKGGTPIDFERASVLVGFSYIMPPTPRFRLVPTLYAQYFEGYGETLVRADEYRRAFRMGLRLLH